MARQTLIRPNTKPLGILGGGQLARMLALKCHELGLPVAIYSASKTDPAAQVVTNWAEGSVEDESALEKFLANCSVVTFESEFMNASLLAKLARQTKTRVEPNPRLMGSIQDRLTQKSLLEKNKLPTARFQNVRDEQAAQTAFDDFQGQVVFKKRRFGYDGYGTFVVKSQDQLDEFLINEFDQGAETGFIAEEFIPFKRELAFVVARSRSQDIARFPFVETHQQNSRCLWVTGPVAPSAQLERIGKLTDAFLGEIGYHGVMGVELFETKDGLYLVNELAPRVHNSAHYSLDALDLDQFSAHLLSVVGASLEKPKSLASGFAMMNLLGQSSNEPSWTLPKNVHLHWYGKQDNRAGRKMGHYNVLASSPTKALALAKKTRASFDV